MGLGNIDKATPLNRAEFGYSYALLPRDVGKSFGIGYAYRMSTLLFGTLMTITMRRRSSEAYFNKETVVCRLDED